MNSPSELAINYWTQPDIENAKRVIAAHANWGRSAAADMPLFLTPKVNAIFGKREDLRALEIGCGIGRLLLPMASRFEIVNGIDICQQMVELSSQYLMRYPEFNARIWVTHCAGDGDIPHPDDKFDFVYSTIVFQHLPDRDTVRNYLRETFRVLRPGGLARIQSFRGPKPQRWDPHWGYFFESMAEFRNEFLTMGFDIVETHESTLFALAECREPIERDWLWITAQK